MKKFRNELTDAILTEQEYKDLRIREYTEMWEDYTHPLIDEFIQDGKTKEDFINYMLKNDIDDDFVEIEE